MRVRTRGIGSAQGTTEVCTPCDSALHLPCARVCESVPLGILIFLLVFQGRDGYRDERRDERRGREAVDEFGRSGETALEPLRGAFKMCSFLVSFSYSHSLPVRDERDLQQEQSRERSEQDKTFAGKHATAPAGKRARMCAGSRLKISDAPWLAVEIVELLTLPETTPG